MAGQRTGPHHSHGDHVDNSVTVSVPDIGDFDEVEIIEVLVHVGDKLALDDSLITVESLSLIHI